MAVVSAKNGKQIFRASDWAIKIHPATGKDINNDGAPDVVFEGYSGGAHCCWTYWIISLGQSPGLARKLCNDRPAEPKDLDGDGRLEIETWDGRFDYFDDLSHAGSPFPTVILRLNGKELRRVNQSFWRMYAAEIRSVRNELNPDDLAKFRAGERDQSDYEATKQKVLLIVLAYLYGGKEGEALKVLRASWPEKDTSRIWKLIRKTAYEGLLGDESRADFGCVQ